MDMEDFLRSEFASFWPRARNRAIDEEHWFFLLEPAMRHLSLRLTGPLSALRGLEASGLLWAPGHAGGHNHRSHLGDSLVLHVVGARRAEAKYVILKKKSTLRQCCQPGYFVLKNLPDWHILIVLLSTVYSFSYNFEIWLYQTAMFSPDIWLVAFQRSWQVRVLRKHTHRILSYAIKHCRRLPELKRPDRLGGAASQTAGRQQLHHRLHRAGARVINKLNRELAKKKKKYKVVRGQIS